MAPKPTIVQLVVTNETGDSYYRMRYPAEELAKHNPEWRIINLDAQASERYQWAKEADLLVLYQSADIDLIPIIKERAKAGKKTLTEYNDNFYASPAWGPVAKEWQSPHLWQRYETFMRESDGVIVTGAGLAELFGKVVSPQKIKIIENHLHSPIESVFKAKPQDGAISIGWGGSLGHMADLLAALPSLEKVISQNKSAKLHLMGNASIPAFVHLAPEKFQFTAWGSLQQYYEFWNPVQIGIAPMLPTAYNRCRSDIKAVEMAGMRVLPILPDQLPYHEFLKKTGLTPYKTLSDLAAVLTRYLTNPALIAKDLERAYQYVCSQRVGPNRSERSKLYQSLLPQTLSSFAWPTNSGYFEIKGTPDSSCPTANALKKAQELLNLKNIPAATVLLEAEFARSDANADLCLALLKCHLVQRSPQAGVLLKFTENKFPYDARFMLAELSAEKSAQERVKLWERLLQKITVLAPEAQNFFQLEMTRLMNAQLVADSALLPKAESLLKIFHNNAELRSAIAEADLRLGKDEEALHHFETIAALQDSLASNPELNARLLPGYIKAWIEALKGRKG